MGTPFVNGSNLHQAMLKFAEVVNAETNGRYKVLVYTDSQIGDIQQLHLRDAARHRRHGLSRHRQRRRR